MDVRRGDMLEMADGHAEVLQVQANNEGGLDLLVRLHANREELSTSVLRAGGPDEREDDKDRRPEEIHEVMAAEVEPVDEELEVDEEE